MVDQPARPSNLAGFDAEFRDLDHYIRVITHRIWEERRLDDIHRYYADPCVVETPMSVSTAREDVVTGTRATLAQFPDRQLLAEDIIISGDAIGGYLSSHRIISPMTHTGDGNFGRATGKPIHVRTIADCVCKDNLIIHEWLVRDQAAIAVALGIPLRALAQSWLDQRGGWNKPVAAPAPAFYRSAISPDEPAQRYANAIRNFTAGRINTADTYDDAAHHLGPGNTTRYGHAQIGAYWQTLFSTFAAEDFEIEHLAIMREGGRATRAALRWRAQTRHLGDGEFGSASGKSVEIMGINHVEFWRGKVIREWVLVDEVALWMQVLGR